MKNKVLLIGGNGYIGCRLYEFLFNEGIDVTNVDVCWYGRVFPKTVVADYRSLPIDFIQEFSHIILLAGHASPAIAGSELLMPCFKNNVQNFVGLVEKMSDDQTLIYASTAAITNSPGDEQIDESYPLANPVDFYTYTKQTIESIAALYPNKKLVGLRFGTVAGHSKNFRSENLFNAISVDAHTKGEFTISNPTAWRSILDIDDLCRAIYCIIHQGVKAPIYNIVSTSAPILNYGQFVSDILKAKMIVNDSLPTKYSFNCSNERFRKDYGFVFSPSLEWLYNDIVSQLSDIQINVKRTFVPYE